MFYQNTEENNREGRKASVWGVGHFFRELIVGWEGKGSKQYNDGTFSSFSAFDEWRSVLRDVEKGAYKYKSTQKITKRKNVSSSLTLFV
jgi:hypothetical protein